MVVVVISDGNGKVAQMTNDELDLFSAYPLTPGHRGGDTSAAAAADIAPDAGRLQALAFRAISDAGSFGLTTNELAEQLCISRDSIQPRTSELRGRRLIGDSGRRRKNESGKSAIVWVAACHLAAIEREAA